MNHFISIVSGILLGYLAGLLGVGGGEFRLPVLLYVLKLPILSAITGNLFVGLATVVFSFIVRLKLGLLDSDILRIALNSISYVHSICFGSIHWRCHYK
ncbi:MAG: hypothetical protein NZ928_04280 [Endomicrobia bacterium]|nr:hypothetical protein [Endomicrobiia bacterium]